MANEKKPIMNVVDISKHNGVVNFDTIKKAGFGGVIIRAGYGKYETQKDPMFETNYGKAVNAEMHIGAYWYSYAQNADDARQEAEVFLKCIAGKKFDLPVYIDIEEQCSRSKATDIVKAFCDVMEEAGYYTGVYASRSYAQSYINRNTLNAYTFWCAEWGTTGCTYDGAYDMWQRTDKGKFNGMNADFDLNVLYKDFPSIIIRDGYNGWIPGVVEDFDEEIPEQETEKDDIHIVEIKVDGKTILYMKGEII